jgi:hypothetical protein
MLDLSMRDLKATSQKDHRVSRGLLTAFVQPECSPGSVHTMRVKALFSHND